jgi:hypothetical protein
MAAVRHARVAGKMWLENKKASTRPSPIASILPQILLLSTPFQAGSRPFAHRSCVDWLTILEQQCLIPRESLAYVEALPQSGSAEVTKCLSV